MFAMKARTLFSSFSVVLCFLAAAALDARETTAPASTEVPIVNSNKTAEVTYPSDEDRLDGDHLKLKVNVIGFKPIDGSEADKAKEMCAPKGSTIIVNKHKGDQILVNIILGKEVKAAKIDEAEAKKQMNKRRWLPSGETASPDAFDQCKATLVNEYTEYSINTATLSDHTYRRSGVMFGALVVPFKFHLGGSKRLSASPTIAPYIGFRGPAPFGLTFAPVFSVGLGLVPVANTETGQTDTKSAFSTAVGVLLTSTKNDKFNAGILFGKDFVSKDDRGKDDTVNKVWFSLYAGYKL
jgi:hypothetical protein